jgi:predicted RNA-binding Zn ribbon-like protein
MAIKLSTQQVEALRNKIYQELHAAVAAHNEAVKESAAYKEFEFQDPDCIALVKMSQRRPEVKVRDFESLIQDIKIATFASQFKTYPQNYDIQNAIILATIDAADLTTLIEAVTAQFKK